MLLCVNGIEFVDFTAIIGSCGVLTVLGFPHSTSVRMAKPHRQPKAVTYAILRFHVVA